MRFKDGNVLQVPVDINDGLTTDQARDLALKLGFHKQADEVLVADIFQYDGVTECGVIGSRTNGKAVQDVY